MMMNIIKAAYGIADGGNTNIEISSASELQMIQNDERNPLKTTTFRTGEPSLSRT